MYVPAAFQEQRLDVLHDAIRRHSFGPLISSGPRGPIATHLAFLLDASRGEFGTLYTHLARANEHWQHFGSGESLAIFAGPHAYVSPSWYATKHAVPTWNYLTVHAYAVPRIIDDAAAARDILGRIMNHYESAQPLPRLIDSLPPAMVAGMLPQIVVVELAITRLEGAAKLSQNKSLADRQGVIARLQQSPHADDQAVARLMADTLPPQP